MDVEVHEVALPTALVVVLERLIQDLLDLHDDPPDEPDPVWERLYPVASAAAHDDAEIRELVHPDVASTRRAALAEIAAHLQSSTRTSEASVLLLDDEQAVLFLGAVNDVRLALAARVQPTLFTEADAQWPPRQASRRMEAMVELVDHLAWLQEQVLASLDPDTQHHYDQQGARDSSADHDDTSADHD